MRYSPEKKVKIQEIEHLNPSIVRIKTHTTKKKGWINFRLNRQITWSFLPSVGDERLWLNSAQQYHTYADITEHDLKTLMYNIILILQFRSYFGTKKVPLKTDYHIRIPQKIKNDAQRDINRVLGMMKATHTKNRKKIFKKLDKNT